VATDSETTLVSADRLRQVIQAEYRESPGLSLTRQQFQRLWALDPCVCDVLIDALLRDHILRRTDTGTYVTYGRSP
jgi:hypothetical protein